MNDDPKFTSRFAACYSLRAMPGDTREKLIAQVTEAAASFRQEFVHANSSITLVDERGRIGQFMVYGNDEAELEQLPLLYRGFTRHPVLPNEDSQLIYEP